MLINVPDNEVYQVITDLKYKHRQSKCTYCGDNLDGSISECGLKYMIKLLERKYEEIRKAS